MAALIVCCPNGRQRKVKVSRNTTLLHVLEEACQKENFDPLKSQLRHNRKTLDLSQSYFHSGLANNAKVDLVLTEDNCRSIKAINVTLQFPDSSRHQSKFESTSHLIDLLLTFREQFDSHRQTDTSRHPVLVYVRNKIIGEYALSHTTFKSLGLLGGNALFRLSFENVSDSELEAIRKDIDQRSAKKAPEKLPETLAPSGCQEAVQVETDVKNQKQHLQAQIKQVGLSQPESVQTSAQNPFSVFNNAPARSIFDSTPTESIFGAGPSSPYSQQQLVTRPAPVSMFRDADRGKFVSQLDGDMHQTNSSRQCDFANFKFPEETAGQQLYQNELSDSDHQIREQHRSCDRHTVFFHLAELMDQESGSSTVEVPDDFFDVTVHDVKIMQGIRKKQADDALSGGLLQTKEQRRANLLRHWDDYRYTVLRFYFPDSLVVQALFRPGETIHAVYRYVDSLFQEGICQFTLLSTALKTFSLSSIKDADEVASKCMQENRSVKRSAVRSTEPAPSSSKGTSNFSKLFPGINRPS